MMLISDVAAWPMLVIPFALIIGGIAAVALIVFALVKILKENKNKSDKDNDKK